jgi:DNA replication protein DnaC
LLVWSLAFSYNIVRDPVHVRDFQATILHQFGIDHERSSYNYQGLDVRPTGVEKAEVVKGILRQKLGLLRRKLGIPGFGLGAFLLPSELSAPVRRQRYPKTRLQPAHLPYAKAFEQFDFGFQPSIDERQIRELRTLRFVHEASNVILLGPPGVGKTHLAVALAEAAIQAGQAAYFMTAHDLVTDLGLLP